MLVCLTVSTQPLTPTIYSNMAANPTHSTAVRMTPEVDVVSLIQFLDLVRGQNLTGNHGTTFLRSFITWISIAGSLTTSLRADLPLS